MAYHGTNSTGTTMTYADQPVIKNTNADGKPVNYYIDKEEFSDEMDIHAADCREYRAKGLRMPRCPESIGKKFLLIATNVSNKGNFFRYSYKDEMVCDAIETMVRYRYNYEKIKGGAFGYFTQYAIYAFISRIKLENKELTKKAKWVQRIAVHELIAAAASDNDLGQDFKNEYIEWLVSYYDQKLEDNDKSKPVIESNDIELQISQEIGPLGI